MARVIEHDQSPPLLLLVPILMYSMLNGVHYILDLIIVPVFDFSNIKEAEMVLLDLSIEVFDICIHFGQVAEFVKVRLSSQDFVVAIAYDYAYTLHWPKWW